MPNRIMEKVLEDEYGGQKTAHDIIRDLLRTEGEKFFGEITKFLEKKAISYSNNKGLSLALKSMIKRGEIGKHKVAGKPHPTYFYKPKGLDYIASLGDEFKRGIIHNISEFPIPERTDIESNEEYFLKKLIHIYGFYMLYTQLQSWKFTSNKKSHQENFDIRRSWFRNTIPLGNESYLFEEGITELTNLRFYNTAEEFNETISKIYQNPKKQKKVIELEGLLKKKYPDEMEFFERIMKKSPDESKKTKKWLGEIQNHEAWKKRIARKNLKNPKKNLKSNQCPVCYYDGTTKVKAGQCKGMIFPAGYVNEFTNNEGEHWHCPACGHWKTKKIV